MCRFDCVAEPAGPPCHLAIERDLLLLPFDRRSLCTCVQPVFESVTGTLLCLTFVQQGQLQHCASKGRLWTFQAGQTVALLLRHPRHAMLYQPCQEASGLHLLLGERTLRRYMGEQQAQRLLGCLGEAPLLQRTTSREACRHVQALIAPLAHAQRSPLDVHLHVLNLLNMPLQQLTVHPAGTRPLLPEGQVKRLQQARQVMLDELDQPLTVQGLSNRVGLSVATLKQGFHQLFSTTPYRMLLELRMQRAYALLQDGCQVAQVGYKVGYRHPSNFSAAFSDYFGIVPKRVGRGRAGPT